MMHLPNSKGEINRLSPLSLCGAGLYAVKNWAWMHRMIQLSSSLVRGPVSRHSVVWSCPFRLTLLPNRSGGIEPISKERRDRWFVHTLIATCHRYDSAPLPTANSGHHGTLAVPDRAFSARPGATWALGGDLAAGLQRERTRGFVSSSASMTYTASSAPSCAASAGRLSMDDGCIFLMAAFMLPASA